VVASLMTKSQIATVAVLVVLIVLVLSVAGAVVTQGAHRMEQVEAYRSQKTPTTTSIPTRTPIPTWTPTIIPPEATSDASSQAKTYLDALRPLLATHWELKTEMTGLYGSMRTPQYCTRNRVAVRARRDAVVATQDRLKTDLRGLAVPRSMRWVHRALVASLAHDEQANLYIFKGCLEVQDPWWPGANIELDAAAAEWDKAREELRSTMADLSLDGGADPLKPPWE